MEAVAIELDAISAIGGASTAPFAEVYVTLTKLEHIQLVMDARYWRAQHDCGACQGGCRPRCSKALDSVYLAAMGSNSKVSPSA